MIAALAPLGRLHQLGAVLAPMAVNAFDLNVSRRAITGRPTSSPARLHKGDVRDRVMLGGPA